ncbi:MAG: glutathione S-transferase family protein [bacterium]|nr:glutathione S-transferase family protein [bacterium]
MQLYIHPNSTYSRRVLMAAHEKGIYDEHIAPGLQIVAMEKLAHKKKDYLAVNPYGRVPALRLDSSRCLFESNVILEYLEEVFPQPALLPADPYARADVRRHMLLADIEFGRPMGVIIFPKRYLPEAKWKLDDMAAAAKQIKRHFKQLSAELGDRQFLTGDQLTLADLSYAPFLQFRALTDLEIPENIEAWTGRLLARDSAQATVPSQ